MNFFVLILLPIFSWAQIPGHLTDNSIPSKNYAKICKDKVANEENSLSRVDKLGRCLDSFLNDSKEYIGMSQCVEIVKAMGVGSTSQAYRAKCHDSFAYDDCMLSAGADDKKAAACLNRYVSSAAPEKCKSEVNRLKDYKFAKSFCDSQVSREAPKSLTEPAKK